MRSVALLLALVGVLACPAGNATGNATRRIPCKVPKNESSCYWTHGRLTYGNGTPAVRLWKIGTHRLLGICSGPSVHRHSMDNEHPELPPNVARELIPGKTCIYADFEVCPLEREMPGAMQMSCIESAKNVFVEHF